MAGSGRSAKAPQGSARSRRLGCEAPRIFTPPLRDLTPETSLGFSVIEFADLVGIELFPWQRWLLIHALELLEDGSFRFRTVVVLVARQNGKSTLSQVLALWAMYVLGIALVLGTAQDLDTAETIWEEAVELAAEVPELAELIAHVDKTNGKKALRLRTGEKYKVKAANRRAGRGLSGDLIMLDELREHQTWDAWAAITKTAMARPNAQTWAFSNAGDAASIVLRYLRRMAHLALGDPDGIARELGPVDVEPDDEDLEADEDTLGIFEWSAPPGCDVWDRDGWAQANPSLGYSITERTIASGVRTDPEWVTRTEVLCQWSDGTLEGPFPPGTWEAGVDATSRIPRANAVSYCVDVSWDRSWSYIGVAGFRKDGRPHVEIVAARAGTDWVVDWFETRAPDLDEDYDAEPMRVVVQAKGAPASSLVSELEGIEGVEVVPWGGADLGAACGLFYDWVKKTKLVERDGKKPKRKGLAHLPQPVLDVAAGTAVSKPLGDAWAWNRKGSPTDIAPLVAVTGALWDAMQHEPEDTESVYETHDLMVV